MGWIVGRRWLEVIVRRCGFLSAGSFLVEGGGSPLYVQVLVEMVERHQKARAAVTEEVVDAFMAVRPMPHLYG